jgi:hypothetical protein
VEIRGSNPLGGTKLSFQKRLRCGLPLDLADLSVCNHHTLDHDPTQFLPPRWRGHSHGLGQREDARPVDVEGDDPIAIGQLRQCAPGLGALAAVLIVADIAPRILLLQALKACRQARALLTGAGQLGRLRPAGQLAPRGRASPSPGPPPPRWRPEPPPRGDQQGSGGPGSQPRAAVVAPVGAALELRLTTHAAAALAGRPATPECRHCQVRHPTRDVGAHEWIRDIWHWATSCGPV